MDLRSIEVFYWVVKLGGFGRAAERLHMTQPGVSQRIGQIEARYRIRLLDRGGARGPVLTPKGLEVFGIAERLLTLQAELMSRLSESVGFSGTVRLGVSETLVHTVLGALITALHERHPLLTPEITVDISPNLRSALLAGEIDVALLLGPVNEPRVRNVFMCDYEMAWVVSPGLGLPRGRLDLATLSRHPILSYARGTLPHAHIVERFAQVGLSTPRIFSSTSISSILRMAADGIGIGALPRAIVAAAVGDGALDEIETEATLPPLHYTASFVASPGSGAAQSVAELAAALAGAELATDPATGSATVR